MKRYFKDKNNSDKAKVWTTFMQIPQILLQSVDYWINQVKSYQRKQGEDGHAVFWSAALAAVQLV